MTMPLTLLLITVSLLAAVVWLIYQRDMRAARARLCGRSRLLASPCGNIEYAEGGTGVDVLVVHAAAGGWDQGELIGNAVLDERFHWIAPSRFGYLRSDCPARASIDHQAHAYAFLLDHLGIDRVAVVAMSAGGPSALLFSALYPRRVSSLTLISCGVAAPVRIFRTDFGLWFTARVFRKSLLERIGAGAADELTLGMGPLRWIDRLLQTMHPASLRSRGVAFDNDASWPGQRIRAIEAPTLIVHARPMVIARARAAIRAAVARHILAHAMEVADVASRPSAA